MTNDKVLTPEVLEPDMFKAMKEPLEKKANRWFRLIVFGFAGVILGLFFITAAKVILS